MSIQKPNRVLVTGAEGGLGSFVSQRFSKLGFQVTGTRNSKKPTREDQGSTLSWINVDLTDPTSVRNSLRGKAFDFVIHCAGGFRYSSVDETSEEDFDFLMNINLKSSFLLVREILPAMKKQNFGRIIFVSSRATVQPEAGFGIYAASKAALNVLTLTLAKEVKEYDITVNSVLPTIIDTPTNRKNMPDARFSDWVTPAELAEIISTLVSPMSKSINGALIPVVGKL